MSEKLRRTLHFSVQETPHVHTMYIQTTCMYASCKATHDRINPCRDLARSGRAQQGRRHQGPRGYELPPAKCGPSMRRAAEPELLEAPPPYGRSL